MADIDYLPDTLLRIILKKGREVPVLRGHPWVFSGAVEGIEGNGETVGITDVFDWEKHWIARGLVSPPEPGAVGKVRGFHILSKWALPAAGPTTTVDLMWNASDHRVGDTPRP